MTGPFTDDPQHHWVRQGQTVTMIVGDPNVKQLWYHQYEGQSGGDEGITMTVTVQNELTPDEASKLTHPVPWGNRTMDLAYKGSAVEDPSLDDQDDWEDDDPDLT